MASNTVDKAVAQLRLPYKSIVHTSDAEHKSKVDLRMNYYHHFLQHNGKTILSHSINKSHSLLSFRQNIDIYYYISIWMVKI